MRNIIYILLALALLSGCQKHNVPSDNILPGRYIFFDAGIQETKSNLVEGESLPAASGTDFGVFGYRPDGAPIFDMYTSDNSAIANVARVYRKENEGPFVYDALALWHKGDHDFYAYYPYSNTTDIITGYGKDDTNGTYIQYTQPTSLDKMVDVMTASAPDKVSSTDPVIFEFNHRLFAFDIIIKNELEYSEQFVINSVKVAFTVPSSSKLYYDGPSVNEGIATVSFEKNDITLNANSESKINGDNSFLFLPGDIILKATIVAEDEWGEDTYNVEKSISGLLAGSKYALTIIKTDGEGFITGVSKLSEWDSQAEKDYIFQ